MENVAIIKSKTDETSNLKKQELKKACREFESFFTAYLLKSMKASIPRAETPEQAREIFETMFDEAIARKISLSGVFKLGDLLYEKLEPLVGSNKETKL